MQVSILNFAQSVTNLCLLTSQNEYLTYNGHLRNAYNVQIIVDFSKSLADVETEVILKLSS